MTPQILIVVMGIITLTKAMRPSMVKPHLTLYLANSIALADAPAVVGVVVAPAEVVRVVVVQAEAVQVGAQGDPLRIGASVEARVIRGRPHAHRHIAVAAQTLVSYF